LSAGLRRAAAVAVALLSTTPLACGGGGDPTVGLPPPKVPVEIVPASLAQGKFSLSEDGKARKAFTTIGPRALVADGRLWAIRVGNTDRLVGTLQVSTMKLKIDLTDPKQRNSVVNNIIPGAKENITVGDLQVVQSAGDDKTVYVWFGRELFEVLQLKRSEKDPIDAETVLAEVIGFQTAQPNWKGLATVSVDQHGEEEG
jgi:hypothetical protein